MVKSSKDYVKSYALISASLAHHIQHGYFLQAKGRLVHKPDHEWVQCDKCRKWRILAAGFNIETLPAEWYSFLVRHLSLILKNKIT